MHGQPVARRVFLKGLGTAVGAAALAGIPAGALAAGDSALGMQEGDQVRLATVLQAAGRVVTVRLDGTPVVAALPFEGFPAAWEFRAGDRVVVWEPEGGPDVVIPYVATAGPARPEVIGDDLVAFGDVAGELSNDAVRADVAAAVRDAEAGSGVQYHGAFVENSTSGRLRAVGVLHGDG